MVRHQLLPHALQAARGGSEAGRVAGRRLSGRDAGDVACRSHAEADHHDVSQLPRHGDEELLRSYPADGAVLMGGCDKTTPAIVMGAISMNLPVLYMPAGPMLSGHWRDQTLGSGSDTWKYWAELRAGNITERDWNEIEDGIARSPGTCMTMGTAATMMSIT